MCGTGRGEEPHPQGGREEARIRETWERPAPGGLHREELRVSGGGSNGVEPGQKKKGAFKALCEEGRPALGPERSPVGSRSARPRRDVGTAAATSLRLRCAPAGWRTGEATADGVAEGPKCSTRTP